jgi:hypothetical protein
MLVHRAFRAAQGDARLREELAALDFEPMGLESLWIVARCSTVRSPGKDGRRRLEWSRQTQAKK